MKAVRRATFVALTVCVFATSAPVSAQSHHRARAAKARPAPAEPRAVEPAAPSGEGATSTETPDKKSKPKVLTFSGLDLEGKLKTPQLLFFLNRVRVELDSSVPAKRSFMKELRDTADDEGL